MQNKENYKNDRENTQREKRYQETENQNKGRKKFYISGLAASTSAQAAADSSCGDVKPFEDIPSPPGRYFVHLPLVYS